MNKTDEISWRKLARACGVAESYLDCKGERVKTPPKTLRRMVGLIRPSMPQDPEVEFQSMRAEKRRAAVQPVIVAWDGKLSAIWIWSLEKSLSVSLEDEKGKLVFKLEINANNIIERPMAGEKWYRLQLQTNEKIPFGYYILRVAATGQENISFVVSAPGRLPEQNRQWGVFAPAYALKSKPRQQIGTYSDLKDAAAFVKQQGGNFLGTLPLLPLFYEGKDSNSSPYSPVSRLFWNEIFLDLANLPGEKNDDGGSSEDSGAYVDYQATYTCKKEKLQQAADCFFTIYPEGDENFKAFAADTPALQAYAAFHADRVPPSEREATRRYHLFAQYACHRQLQTVKSASDDGESAALYLDYPVGVHPAGFDAQAFPDLFLDKASVGAPPDLFFTKGQNWGFRPYSPRGLEADRFSYLRASLHNYFCYARMIRLDHIMGLYRIYCIPDDADAGSGAYIYYPFQSLLAILCLEAWRHDGVLIGENLGTVPEAVNTAMRQRGINRMWIWQFDLKSDPVATFGSIEPDMFASLNTHDMFPFESFLHAKDIDKLEELGLLHETAAADMAKDRDAVLKSWRQLNAPLDKAIEGMVLSPARYVMVALEDLWHAAEPQNIPGTVTPENWSRKFHLPLRDWSESASLMAGVKILNQRTGL